MLSWTILKSCLYQSFPLSYLNLLVLRSPLDIQFCYKGRKTLLKPEWRKIDCQSEIIYKLMVWPAVIIKYRPLSGNKWQLNLQINFHNNLFSLANKCSLHFSGLASTSNCLKIFYKPIPFQTVNCKKSFINIKEHFREI